MFSRYRAPAPIVVLIAALVAVIGIAVTFAQYHAVRTSFFDDTFIYLHVAQNAVEFGTWQYFPISERSAMVASSPLRAIVLTVATALCWPFTGGERSLASAAMILPFSAVLSALVFLPFWWRDRARYLVLLAPYALLCVAFESMSEFEGGLLYWWIATVMRDYAERNRSVAASFAIMLGPLVRPDLGALGLIALLLAHWRQGEKLHLHLRAWFAAAVIIALIWITLSLAFGVWPIPTTYWTKAAVPKLFDTSFMVSFFFERSGQVALGSAPWSSRSLAAGLGVFWSALAIIVLARSRAYAGAGAVVMLLIVLLYLARTPANFWWYYQNALIAFAAVAVALVLLYRDARGVAVLLLMSLMVVSVAAKAWRDPVLPWNFAQPSRAQGYQAMAKTFAADGTIELPGLGRGYLVNPEIGITAYFGGRNAFIGDSAGLAQAIPQSLRSKLRYVYPTSLRTTYEADLARLSGGRSVTLFEAWATETRDENLLKHCKHVVLDRTVCVSNVRSLSPTQR
jgi:hypothetical protein